MLQRSLLLLLALLLTLPACGRRGGGGGGGDDDDSAADDDDVAPDDDDAVFDDDDTSLPCEDGQTGCDGWEFLECVDSAWTVADECLPPLDVCHDTLGCLECNPGIRECDGNSVVECNGDGTATTWIEDCPPEAPCVAGQCRDACDNAAATYSYLGCEFFATSTANLVDATFNQDFGVVVANPQGATSTANITVQLGSSTVATANLLPGQTQAIELSMINEIRLAEESVVATDAAYEITSTQPIVAYQYNPLHFQLFGTPSYSNDASLLLPVHTLTGNYMISHLPSFGVGQGTGSGITWSGFSPPYFAVIGTEDGTSVTMNFTGDTMSGNPPAHSSGQSETVTINRGDVIQVLGSYPQSPSGNWCANNGWQSTSGTDIYGTTWTYCLGTDSDLSGTTIDATAAVSVVAGHMCTFVPYNAWACDHLEESMFPIETWGDQTVMTAPRFPGSGGVAPTRYRVLALEGGTEVSFDPGVASTTTLGAGQHMEFESDQDFVVNATGPIYVTQFMEGQDAIGAAIGDPAMGSGIPWSQVRLDYDFLTPDTYTENYVNVVAPNGSTINLDLSPITGWTAIGSTGFSVARIPLIAGSHHVESVDGNRFGITTYGYAEYTSYLYPGGLNFGR